MSFRRPMSFESRAMRKFFSSFWLRNMSLHPAPDFGDPEYAFVYGIWIFSRKKHIPTLKAYSLTFSNFRPSTPTGQQPEVFPPVQQPKPSWMPPVGLAIMNAADLAETEAGDMRLKNNKGLASEP